MDADTQRSFGYYYDGDWQDWSGKGKATEERLTSAGSTAAPWLRW